VARRATYQRPAIEVGKAAPATGARGIIRDNTPESVLPKASFLQENLRLMRDNGPLPLISRVCSWSPQSASPRQEHIRLVLRALAAMKKQASFPDTLDTADLGGVPQLEVKGAVSEQLFCSSAKAP
jgi:hypothetical protein